MRKRSSPTSTPAPDLEHGDIAPNLWTNPDEIPGNGIDDDNNGFSDDVNGYDFVNHDANPSEDGFHGTHTAGTIAARGNDGGGVTGVSQRADLMILKVCFGSGGCAIDAMIASVNYAAANGARVLNGSLGGFGASQGMYDAIAAAKDVLFVFSAGNSNVNVDQTPTYPCTYELDNIICVGASTQTDGRAGFSNYGPKKVDLFAPGTETLSDGTGRSTSRLTGWDFETEETWGIQSGGTAWTRSTEAPLTSNGLSDSPGGTYAENTTYSAVSPEAVTLSSKQCTISYRAKMSIGAGDRFGLEYSKPNGAYEGGAYFFGPREAGWNTYKSTVASHTIGSPVHLQLTLVSDGSGVADGVQIDDVEIGCPDGQSSYDTIYLNGTSMAAPHVTGAAGLIFSRNPGVTPLDAKQVLLDSADVKPEIPSVTNGRLNINGAIRMTSGDTAITHQGRLRADDIRPASQLQLQFDRPGVHIRVCLRR